MSTSATPTPSDPRPQPPAEPAPEDCCRSGCMPCVFDLYSEALERYEQALAGWLARHLDAHST
ncbi:oxidoreductase-like domain-containing protein [Massilia horti]|uniref:Oxidoreductase-like domain-containing protein n=1 Tax=Massilia horti TaxID=2562153 RepID=A0A4Y9T215_9BURK|nr:oxidoreductase-like domain-containing protein [Massilia horti]TFW33648.1 hypothetical protein E4O92_06550 [Massilia horti]